MKLINNSKAQLVVMYGLCLHLMDTGREEGREVTKLESEGGGGRERISCRHNRGQRSAECPPHASGAGK